MKRLRKILLVDDDELFNYIHLEILKNQKIVDEIVVATNGKSALTFFEGAETEFPEVILLDIDMPIMNGFEFLEELFNRSGTILSHTHIIMLTSSFNDRDMEKAKEYNVAGYLNKPLSVNKLQEILDKLG